MVAIQNLMHEYLSEQWEAFCLVMCKWVKLATVPSHEMLS